MMHVHIALWALVGFAIGAAMAVYDRRLLRTRHPYEHITPCVVATLTSTVFGILAWRFGSAFELLPYSCVAAVGVELAAIDILEQRLPSALVYCGLVVTGALFAASAILHSSMFDLLRALAGMTVLAVFYLSLALISGGGLGAGDVKLGGLLGLALGWSGWSVLIAATFLGWFAGAAWLVVRMARRRPRNSPLPMGPFLLFGALLAITLMPR